MSAFEVYFITADGDVKHLGDVRNPYGAAPHVWGQLSKKYGVPDPFLCRNANSNTLWRLFNSGKLTEDENVLLGFTFDAVWVKRENVPRLVEAIERWWPPNRQAWNEFEKRFYGVTPTLEGVADLLRKVPEDARGVCFNGTSVNSNPWWIYDKCVCAKCGDEHREEEGRSFNFDRDEMNNDDRKPWELFSQ